MDGNGSAAEYREALQADGYDGLTIEDEEFGGISFVAFSPNQIKSATANSGAFSPADDSILRSKTAGTSHPSTVADVRAGVAETLGQGIADALEKTGILKIHATPETLPENVRKKAGHDPRFPDTLNVNLDAVLAGRHLGNDVSSLLNSMTFELFD
jgi:hypothetical protein